MPHPGQCPRPAWGGFGQPGLGATSLQPPCVPGSLPHVPPLLRTKQRHGVESRRACIASGCGVSGETSSRQEKRTEGLKMIPVSRVTHCHANSPGANPIPGGRGDGAAPQCSPQPHSPAGPRRVWGQPLFSSSSPKNKRCGASTPTGTRGAEGGGTRHGPFRAAGRHGNREGVSSVKCHSHANSSVPRERRGSPPPREPEHSVGPGRGWQRPRVPRSLPLSLGSSVQL